MLINNIREFVQECTECYYYYVELHMSYDKVAKEVLLSPASVKAERWQNVGREIYSS